jgi:FkbM family methyltransferase
MIIQLPVSARDTFARALRWIAWRIRSGPNAGRRWSVTASGRGQLSGSWERERFETMSALIRPEDCVWDVGAHQGYSVLVAAGAVEPESAIVAFEPSAYNRGYLEQHVAWNRCSNVQVVPVALADRDCTERFGGTHSSLGLQLGGGSELVEVRSADSVIRDGLPQPSFVKVDIEGAEAELLAGATAMLQTVEVIMVAVHSRPLHDRCVPILQDAGFEVHQDVRIGNWLRESPTRWEGDPDVIAVRPDLTKRRDEIARLSQFERVPSPAQGR